MASEAEIRFERRGAAGIVTFDRPAALNAVTHEMVRRLGAELERWRHDGGRPRARGAGRPSAATTKPQSIKGANESASSALSTGGKSNMMIRSG